MKRLLIAIGCLMVMAGPASAVSVTINDLTLYRSGGEYWNTTSNFVGVYILGVSSIAGGPLLNNPSTGSISGLDLGTYYLYASTGTGFPYDPAWKNIRLTANLSDGSTASAYFDVKGTPGSGLAWTWISGDPDITLGWASGTADLVHTFYLGAGSGTDIYLKAGIVPIPGAVWLLGSGIVGLIGLKRRGIKRNENGR